MTAPDTADPVRAIARAVLYEGYMLWPYRRSALKNQKRWNFGCVLPRAWSEAGHADDAATMTAGCLVELPDDPASAAVDVEVRFLHLVERRAARVVGNHLCRVDEIRIGDVTYTTWDEAIEREIPLRGLRLDRPDDVGCAIAIPGGEETEWLAESDGEAEGALVRSWQALKGVVRATTERIEDDLVRLKITVTNQTPCEPDSREAALRVGLLSTHMALHARGGARFVSVIDPPERYRGAVGATSSDGCWPVLVGDPAAREQMLASPIVLPDFPAIAPESPGDHFDGGEIDELLVLNILGLSDDEQAEMLATDPRTREVLERTRALDRDQIIALHGTFRDMD